MASSEIRLAQLYPDRYLMHYQRSVDRENASITKRRASIGNIGGNADMQIDDPETSALHCAVAITDNGVRLYDLDSVNGTYVDDVRIQVADLEELSTFRVGST